MPGRGAGGGVGDPVEICYNEELPSIFEEVGSLLPSTSPLEDEEVGVVDVRIKHNPVYLRRGKDPGLPGRLFANMIGVPVPDLLAGLTEEARVRPYLALWYVGLLHRGDVVRLEEALYM